MKLILTQEVDGLGAPGDVVEVKDGYGRNYLVPRGLGIRWTRGGEKTIESIKAARTARAVRDEDHAKDVKAKLEANPVNVQVRAGAGGRLFGAVTTTEIADAVTEVSGASRASNVNPRPSASNTDCPDVRTCGGRWWPARARKECEPKALHTASGGPATTAEPA